MCTRIKHETGYNTYIIGRGLDWDDPEVKTDLWAFPKGMERDGGTGSKSLKWSSKHGSLSAVFYNAACIDGMNEKGLVCNALYLVESDCGDPSKTGKPTISIGIWTQYYLDNIATVTEAVHAMQDPPFTIVAPMLPNGRLAAGHLSISDPSGDSAISEYLDRELVIHHGVEHGVMTNSPTYDQQIAINAYWKLIGGDRMLPETINAADRHGRASYFLENSPKYKDPEMAVASVFSQMRSIGVSLGMEDPDHPNISATLWRSVIDHDAKRYYFESNLRPAIFWVDLEKLNLEKGADVIKLETLGPKILSAEVSSEFKQAKPSKILSLDEAAGSDVKAQAA